MTDQISMEKAGDEFVTKSLADIDLATVKEGVIKGVVYSELALMAQLQLEHNRIIEGRNNLAKIDEIVSDPAFLQKLTATQKLKLYAIKTADLARGMDFMTKIQAGIGSKLDALNTAERLQQEKKALEERPAVSNEIVALKEKLLKKMKELTAKKPVIETPA
tara:strand:- start:2279 stop:2764 length:486 start_codon:yes stop_codon:yes gene_type:complete